MKELSKLAKFFIICAAVFLVGLVCTIVGVMTGGPHDIEKLADRYDWIQGSPGERGVTAQKVEDYHSIQVTGDADLWIVGEDFYKKASWFADQDILEQTERDVIGKNKVAVVCGDKVEQPEISVKGGVLKVNSGPVEFSGLSFNMSDENWNPKILICAPADTLQSLTVSGQVGDVNILGAAWEEAKIELNAGDVSMEGVKSGGLTVVIDSGDVELEGKLLRTTQVTSEAGDIDVDTSLAKAEYALQLTTDAGDIKVKEGSEEEKTYESGKTVDEMGGPHKMLLKSDSGDLKVRFEGQ